MRIVHLSFGALPAPFGDGGGALQRRVAELAREQVRRGHRVRVLAAERFTDRRLIDGADVRFLRSISPSPWLHLEHQARSVAALARDEKADVIHVHNEPEAAVIGRLLNVPMVLHYDNYFFRGHRRLFQLYRHALSSFDLLMPVSEYCRSESLVHWDLGSKSSLVVPNGVNIQQFAPRPEQAAEQRRRLELGAGPVLLYVGRICKQKGSATLLEAFRHLRRVRTDLQLVMAGPIEQFGAASAPSEQAWRQDMSRSGARYLGVVPEVALAALMNVPDIFVMPTAELEMQGMAALEAMGSGIPVVASDHGGLPETVPEGCGLRFPPGDVGALVDAIERLLDDREMRRCFAGNARAHAESLSWPRICARLDEAYQLARSSG